MLFPVNKKAVIFAPKTSRKTNLKPESLLQGGWSISQHSDPIIGVASPTIAAMDALTKAVVMDGDYSLGPVGSFICEMAGTATDAALGGVTGGAAIALRAAGAVVTEACNQLGEALNEAAAQPATPEELEEGSNGTEEKPEEQPEEEKEPAEEEEKPEAEEEEEAEEDEEDEEEEDEAEEDEDAGEDGDASESDSEDGGSDRDSSAPEEEGCPDPTSDDYVDPNSKLNDRAGLVKTLGDTWKKVWSTNPEINPLDDSYEGESIYTGPSLGTVTGSNGGTSTGTWNNPYGFGGYSGPSLDAIAFSNGGSSTGTFDPLF